MKFRYQENLPAVNLPAGISQHFCGESPSRESPSRVRESPSGNLPALLRRISQQGISQKKFWFRVRNVIQQN